MKRLSELWKQNFPANTIFWIMSRYTSFLREPIFFYAILLYQKFKFFVKDVDWTQLPYYVNNSGLRKYLGHCQMPKITYFSLNENLYGNYVQI